MMRPVHAAGHPVHEKRFVGRESLMIIQPFQGLIGHVHSQMIFRIVVWRFYMVVIFGKARLPLRSLAAEKAVEILEAITVRPAVFWPHRGSFGSRCIMPLAERGCMITVLFQYFSNGRCSLRNDPGVAVERHRALGDGPGADPGMVAPGEQRCARRRANRSGMESVVANAFFCQFGKSGRAHLAAESLGDAKTDIVKHDDENIRRIVRQTPRFVRPLHFRVLQPRLCFARHWRRWERQD